MTCPPVSYPLSRALSVPGVWAALQTPAACTSAAVWRTGHAALDGALTGGGWPQATLVEVLCTGSDPLAALLTWPALVAQVCAPKRLVLVGPPATPSVQAWQWRGLAPWQWAQVQTNDPARRLWACEQALACAEVAAVLAWLPQASFQSLRRLQLAVNRHGGMLWVVRPLSARQEPSPASLRLELRAGGEPGQMQVRIVKQRGLLQPLTLSLPLSDPWARQMLVAARWRQAQSNTPVPAEVPFHESAGHQAGTRAEPHTQQHADAQLARLLGRLAQPVHHG